VDPTERKAAAFLESLRSTAMRRGAITRGQRQLKTKIARVLEKQGITAGLSDRMALQLVFKHSPGQLHDRAVWQAIGRQLKREVARLETSVGLAGRQIVEVLPKLSPSQVEGFLEELRTTDRRIARTILNAAIEAADPLSTGRRYLAEYRAVADQLQKAEHRVARTLANASFTARAPRKRALEHFKRFANLVEKFKGDVDFERLLAKAVFRAPDPLQAAHEVIGDYLAALAVLTAAGVESPLARTLAGSSRVRGHLRAISAKSHSTHRGA